LLAFVLRRLLYALPILFGVSLFVFALVHLMPGSPIDVLVGNDATAATVAEIKRMYGLDRPLGVQYGLWLGEVLGGNLGLSIYTGRSITRELLAAVGATLQITLLAALVGFSLGILLGASAARWHGRWPDKLLSVLSIFGVSVPHYWFGIVLVVVFSVELQWLPAQGMGPPGIPLTWEQWKYVLLPVATLSMIPMGVIGRLVRASVLEVLSQDFVDALRAKGLGAASVARHVAKNAAPPVLALMGLQFGYLLGGSILIETVFNWPGTGNLLNLAIFRRDLPVVQATILLLAFLFVVVNLAVDVLQAAIDPRMRR
jgi:peptide/nickel transport system permease protein